MPCTGDAYFPSQMVVCSPSTGAPLTLWAWLKTAITWVSTQISPPQSGTLSLQSTVVYFYLFPPCPVIPILPACLIFFTEHITSSSDLSVQEHPQAPATCRCPADSGKALPKEQQMARTEENSRATSSHVQDATRHSNSAECQGKLKLDKGGRPPTRLLPMLCYTCCGCTA